MMNLCRELRTCARIASFAGALATAPVLAQQAPFEAKLVPGDVPEQVIFVPAVDENLDTYDMRQYAQQQSIWRFEVFHEFKFTDKRADSGIDFLHRIVDDAGKNSKAVHYDHGTGMSVGDVDGDGKLDIYFISQLGGNQLWKNLGGGKFANITKEAGVGLSDGVSVSASFADVDNDGDVDLYVNTVRTGNALFENDGKGKFKNITEAAGLTYSGHSSGATFFDYDRDGKLDLFVDNIGKYTTEVKGRGGYWVGVVDGPTSHLYPERREDSKLYHNLGGNRFEDVTNAMGVADNGFDGDASFNDINGDGYPDLYVLCMQGDNHYYENDAGKRFVDKTAEVFPKTSWGAMGLKFFDYNNDGLADLYITDMHSDMTKNVPPAYEKSKSINTRDEKVTQGGANNIWGNSFFQMSADRTLVEVSDRIGAENYLPWGVSVGDLNADGWEDMFVTTGMNYPGRYMGNNVMLNNRGKTFLDAEFLTGVEPRQAGPSSRWFDLECSAEDQKHPQCAGQTGHKVVYASAGSKSSAIFDLDGDGDLDIVTSDYNDHPQVLINDLTERNQVNYLSVNLSGSESNREGLGARVRVQTDRRLYTKWNDGKSGYLSQSAVPVYFGLGGTANIQSVEVLWPSGKTTRTESVTANQSITLSEDDD